jgi:hypothetical protein
MLRNEMTLRHEFFQREYLRDLIKILIQLDILPSVLYNIIAEYTNDLESHFQDVKPSPSHTEHINDLKSHFQEVKSIPSYIDNSDLIKNNLYTILAAPPGSGKSTLLSTYAEYFNFKPKKEIERKSLTELKIHSRHNRSLDHHPVIYLNLELIVGETFKIMMDKFDILITNIFKEHDIPLGDNLNRSNNITIKLINTLYNKYHRGVCLIVDNYDAPILAGFYYDYYDAIKQWMNKNFNHYFVDLGSYHIALFAGLGLYHDIFDKLIYAKKYSVFNKHIKDQLIFSDQTALLWAHWVTDLIKMHPFFIGVKKIISSNIPMIIALENTYLDLPKIKKDTTEFIKFLIYMGYITPEECAREHHYKLHLHPTLVDLIHIATEEIAIQPKPLEKEAKHIKIIEKDHKSVFDYKLVRHSFISEKEKKNSEIKKTESILFVNMHIFHRNMPLNKWSLSTIKYHPLMSGPLFKQLQNKQLLDRLVHFLNFYYASLDDVAQIKALCFKTNSKIVLVSQDDGLPNDFEHTQLILSLTSIGILIANQIVSNNHHQNTIEGWLIKHFETIKSFAIINYPSFRSPNSFFNERTHNYNIRSDVAYTTIKNNLTKTMSIEIASSKHQFEAFNINHPTLRTLTINAAYMSQVKIAFGWQTEKFLDMLFLHLERNTALTHLELHHFCDPVLKPYDHFILRLATALSKRRATLEYLNISDNALSDISALLSVLDGKKHHIPYIIYNNNTLTLDAQVALAQWIRSYPSPIIIEFLHDNPTDYQPFLDACILKALQENNLVCLHLSTAHFQAIHTPMKNIREVCEKLIEEGRLSEKVEMSSYRLQS